MKKITFSTKEIVVMALVALVVVLGIAYWPKESVAPVAPGTATQGNASSTASSSAAQGTASSGSSGANAGAISVTTTLGWKTYESSAYGIIVSYPSDWQIGSLQPLILDNFNNKYEQGDIVPLGGAEIDIVGTMASGPVADIVNTELMGKTITATSTATFAGVQCQEFFYGGSYAKNYPSKNIAAYCPGPMLIKAYLTYRAEDPKGASYAATFKQLLGAIKLIK